MRDAALLRGLGKDTMNRKTLVTAAVAGALGLAVVTAPAVASAFGTSDEDSTSVVIPGGVVTDTVAVDEPALDRSTAVRTPVQTPVASAVPVPPPAPQEPDDDSGEYVANTEPSPVVPPVTTPDDEQDRTDRDRDDDGPKHVNPEPHSPSDDADGASDGDRDRHDDGRGGRGDRDDDRRDRDQRDHDHRHGDDDDRRDDDGWSR